MGHIRIVLLLSAASCCFVEGFLPKMTVPCNTRYCSTSRSSLWMKKKKDDKNDDPIDDPNQKDDNDKKNLNRAHFERNLEEAMDNDWRAFRAKLVAQEKASGRSVVRPASHDGYRNDDYYNGPSIYSSNNNNNNRMPNNHIRRNGNAASDFRPNMWNNHQVNWHGSNPTPTTDPFNNPDVRAYNDPYTSHLDPNSAYGTPYGQTPSYDNNQFFRITDGPERPSAKMQPPSTSPQQLHPNSAYDAPYGPTSSFNSNQFFRITDGPERPSAKMQPPTNSLPQRPYYFDGPSTNQYFNRLNCDDVSNNEGYDANQNVNPNQAQFNWHNSNAPAFNPSSMQQRNNQDYFPRSAFSPAPHQQQPSYPSDYTFKKHKNANNFPDHIRYRSQDPANNCYKNYEDNIKDDNSMIHHEDPLISEALERQIQAEWVSSSIPNAKLDKHRWAHEIPGIEPGAVLLANERLGDMFFQTVILITQHHPTNGTFGIIINRPLEGSLMEICKEPSRTLNLSLKMTFRHSRVSFGGPEYPDEYSVLHSFGEVSGARKICHGVYLGGSQELMNEVRLGRMQDEQALFVKGHVAWPAGQLQQELREGGIWYMVATSPDFILRYAGAKLTPQDNPNNLWADILSCMGGYFKGVAQRYGRMGNSDSGRRWMP